MSTFIYVPKPYELSDPELTETLSSPMTYKSAVVDGELEPDVGGFMCAYGEGESLLMDGVTSSVVGRINAWAGNDADAAILDGRVIHFAPCDRYQFDGLENADWSPDVFREQATYHNNFSSTGQFIGRSVIRRSREMTVAPISFNAPPERMQELFDIKRAMETTPIYVRVCAPMAEYVVFGWTEDPPAVSYLTDYGQVSLSFNLRVPA